MTYRSFATPELLLRKLIERYRVPSSAAKDEALKIRTRVGMVLHKWLTIEYKDLGLPDGGLAPEIREFVKTDLETNSTLSKMFQTLLLAPPTTIRLHQTKVNTRLQLPKKLSLFELDEEEIARQITMMIWKIYPKITYTEFLGNPWSREKTHHKCPHLLEMVEIFNSISAWVSTAIVVTPSARQRAKVMTKFIKVANHLRDMNNYHAVTAIVSGVNNSSVLRLKWTRAKVHKRFLTSLKSLEDLVSMEGSFKNYRQALKGSAEPCIPYIGVYLTDLTFVEDGNADTIDGLINFSKRRFVYKIIALIRRYQAKQHDFAIVPPIQAWLETAHTLDDNSLYTMSLQAEPRNAARSAIK
eukprot:TRINITY_DN12286_c0_g1_i1.p1 TRINITY_DN12286_c0_g1~~TRINITY_DN12286_c0_g1_i1.p1  ORF type:complete len:355 (+),score=31.60 TRINITY_DN12286_c0_g1_i1:201-1265(+)